MYSHIDGSGGIMNLSRYQFELLTYVEKKKRCPYSIREISDTLCISGNMIKAIIEWATEKKYIGICSDGGQEENLEILDNGYQILEPYRVTKAVILAAGFGSRMLPATEDRPKPMVTVNGVRIIDTLLDSLVKVGITDISLVRGYKKERFDELLEKYPFLQLIDNDIYEQTNNISSALLVLDKMTGCYLCESDLYITNPDVITKYQYTSNILGSWSLETDDWSFRMEDGYITDYQKGNTYCWNYYGISYWTPEDCEKLRHDFIQVYEKEDGGKDYFWEFIPLVLRKDRYRVEIRQCQKTDIMEIDNYYELAQLDPSYR